MSAYTLYDESNDRVILVVYLPVIPSLLTSSSGTFSFVGVNVIVFFSSFLLILCYGTAAVISAATRR